MSGKRRKFDQKAHKIIGCFYPKQFSLLRYLHMVDSSLCLRNKDDTRKYRQLLRSTLVAIPRNQLDVVLSQKPRHTQWCTTSEIIHRVIETACNSKSGFTSVLALGYERLRGNNKCGMVAGTSGIQNSYPNTIVSYLKSAQPWQTLHSRVGDDLMIHLFQNLALFVKMPSRCYLQISGHPIGSLSPLGTGSTCHVKSTSSTITNGTCHLKSTSRDEVDHRRHTKSSNLCRKATSSLSSRGDSMPKESNTANASTTNQSRASLKRKRRRIAKKRWKGSKKTDDTSAVQKDSRCEADITTSGLSETPTRSVEDQEQKSHDTPQIGSFGDEETSPDITAVCERSSVRLSTCNTEPSEETTTIFRREKRKADDRDDDEEEGKEGAHCSKRRKRFTDAESKSEDIAARVLASLHGGRASMNPGPSEEQPPPKSASSKVLKRKRDPNRGLKQAGQLASDSQKTVQMAKKRRSCLRAVLGFLRRRRLSGKIPRKRARIISKNREAKSGKSPRTAPSQHIPKEKKSTPNQMYIPRSKMFFASNLCQKLPKKHILEVTPVSQRGARKLIRAIFLETPETKEKNMGKVSRPPASDEPTLKSKNKKDVKLPSSGTADGAKVSTSKKEKPDRLPSRLHRLQSIFTRFLARHKSCRFRLLLRCHCPYKRVSRSTGARSKKPDKNKRVGQKSPDSSSITASSKQENDQQERCSIGSREKLLYRQAVNNYTPYHQVRVSRKAIL